MRNSKNKERPPKFLIRPTAIKYEVDKQLILIKKCFIKPYSRYLVTTTVEFKLLVPQRKSINIQMLIYYRYGITVFREIIDTKKLNGVVLWREIGKIH